MKVVLKIGIWLLTVAGVLYWLFGKVLQPARRLKVQRERGAAQKAVSYDVSDTPKGDA